MAEVFSIFTGRKIEPIDLAPIDVEVRERAKRLLAIMDRDDIPADEAYSLINESSDSD